MLTRGGAIAVRERSAERVVFAYTPPVSCMEYILVIVGAIFTFGLALLYLAFRFWFKQEVGLIARPANGGAVVTVYGADQSMRRELENWAGENLEV
jgi:hypothetical protein